MRSFIPRLKNSCLSFLGLAESTPDMLIDQTEDIRQLMLCEMGEYGEKYFPGVARRVRYAADAQGLWYARSDVMAILASTHGETIARERIETISGKFKGLLPISLTGATSARPR